MTDDSICHECGQPFFLTETDIAHHLDTASFDGINHSDDADHVPYSLDV